MNNYHTHTYRCKHADGDVYDYASEAVKRGMDVLGMSDHCPLPDRRWSHVRMDIEQLPDYERAIELAQRRFPELRIVKGLECEWIPEFRSFYEETFLKDNRFEYLICGIHWFPSDGEWKGLGQLDAQSLRSIFRYAVEAMETGLFLFLAHPDNFGIGYREWDDNCTAFSKDLLEAAEALNMPLEINGYGMRKSPVTTADGKERWKYPLYPFWELASDYDIKVVCNSDAHKPYDVNRSIDSGIRIARQYELEVIDFASQFTKKTETPEILSK